MNTLDQHIEQLLLTHECVVVPGFGGFITHYVQADADNLADDESVLYPPFRTVRFNQDLTDDDGLLIHAYMTADDTTYIAATQQMQIDLARLLAQLATQGSYTLDNIGTLRQDLAGHITLDADEAGIATPKLYGMGSLTLQPVDSLMQQRQVQQAIRQTTILPIVPAPQQDDKTAEDPIVVKIHRRWVDIAISAAAAVILFVLLAYPTMQRPAQHEDTIVAGQFPKTSNTAKQTAQSPKTKQTPAPKTKKPATKPAPQPARLPYTIVLACYVSERNANIFIERLAQKGLREARYDKSGRISRILYSAYPDEPTAQQALRQLRGQSPEFAEAWIMHL